MDYRQRVYFGRATLDDTPGELLHSVFEHTKPERLDFPDADVFLRITSKAERMRLRACAKEPFTVEWLREHVGAGDVLFDIGANIGVYSLIAAKKPGGGARVRFTVASAYGFTKRFQNPNIDPHQPGERRFRRVGLEGARAAGEY